jgi:hypothetical protein
MWKYENIEDQLLIEFQTFKYLNLTKYLFKLALVLDVYFYILGASSYSVFVIAFSVVGYSICISFLIVVTLIKLDDRKNMLKLNYNKVRRSILRWFEYLAKLFDTNGDHINNY